VVILLPLGFFYQNLMLRIPSFNLYHQATHVRGDKNYYSDLDGLDCKAIMQTLMCKAHGHIANGCQRQAI